MESDQVEAETLIRALEERITLYGPEKTMIVDAFRAALAEAEKRGRLAHHEETKARYWQDIAAAEARGREQGAAIARRELLTRAGVTVKLEPTSGAWEDPGYIEVSVGGEEVETVCIVDDSERELAEKRAAVARLVGTGFAEGIKAAQRRSRLTVIKEEMREKGCEPAWEDGMAYCNEGCPKLHPAGTICRIGSYDLSDKSGVWRAEHPPCYPMIEAMSRTLESIDVE